MPPDSNDALLLSLGEMKGQMREVIHTVNNSQQKLDTLYDVIYSLKPLIKEVEDLRGRVSALEIDLHKRAGAITLIERVGASPIFWAILFGVAGLIAIYGFIKGE